MLAVQKTAAANELPFHGRVADLDAFLVGINDPGDLRPAPEEVLKALVDFGAAIVGRKDLDRQIRRARKESFFRGPKPQAVQARFGNERYIRSAAVAVVHPK